MGFFKKSEYEKQKAQIVYNKEELFRKEKEKQPMTFDELEALNLEKRRELTNQILRILGLFTAMVIIVLAIGTYLYPLSVFNLFRIGGTSTFWESYSNFAVKSHGHWYTLDNVIKAVWHGKYDSSIISTETMALTYTNEFGELVNMITNGHGEYQSLSTLAELPSGWNYVQTPFTQTCEVGFIDVFYMLGGWTMVAVATVALVAVVIGGAYIVAYNIKDFIKVVKHFLSKTDYIVTDIGKSLASSVADTKDKQVSTQQPKKQTKKKEKPAPKTEEELVDDEVSAKVAEYKKQLSEEDTNNIEPVKQGDLASMGDADLDKLLR